MTTTPPRYGPTKIPGLPYYQRIGRLRRECMIRIIHIPISDRDSSDTSDTSDSELDSPLALVNSPPNIYQNNVRNLLLPIMPHISQTPGRPQSPQTPERPRPSPQTPERPQSPQTPGRPRPSPQTPGRPRPSPQTPGRPRPSCSYRLRF